MATTTFNVDTALFDQLVKTMKAAEGDTEKEINSVLWEQGGNMINDAIMLLLPRSGRTWKGKKAAAADAKPFEKKNENLAVTVRTKYAYHYLYFPDDGSNTRKHAGGQNFMYRGAENEQEKIIQLCIEKLVENLGG